MIPGLLSQTQAKLATHQHDRLQVQVCNRCGVKKARDCFGTLKQDSRNAKAGDRHKTCTKCLDRQLRSHREKQKGAVVGLSRPLARGSLRLPLVPFMAFIDQIRNFLKPSSEAQPPIVPCSNEWAIQSRVDLTDTIAEMGYDHDLESLEEIRNKRANIIAEAVWECSDYRFV